MGELHLEIIVDRLKREFKVEVNLGSPQVSYKETITSKGTGEARYERQVAGKGLFGHCILAVEPRENGEGFKFENKLKDGVLPKEYIPAIEQGVKEAMETGVLAGYSMVDLKATLIGATFHEEDSNELAFKIAASMAFRSAVQQASPVLMEPISRLEVLTPEEFMGSVIGDLNSRRGKVSSMTAKGKTQIVTAEVPLSTMFGYATELRSITQGRATFTLVPSHYWTVPPKLQDEILVRLGRK
jgi:elongation factor G